MKVKEKEKIRKKSFISELSEGVRKNVKNESEKVGTLKLWINICAVILGFLFGGCHLVFGSYPLGLAFVCALPSSVWFALAGVCLGSLTLGRSGVIYALITLLAVFLRIIISGGEIKNQNSEETARAELFEESTALKVSAAVICGFVASIYEMLLESFSLRTLLFGVCMIVLPAVLTFVFSASFYPGITLRELIFGKKRIFNSPDTKKERIKLYLFRASALAFVALAAYSLNKYNFLGIDLSFVFAGCITLFTAKRFGAVYGAAVGFSSALLISGLYSAGFALLGLVCGALFAYGAWLAPTLGGIALTAWGAYISGVSGFLTLLPEYLISVCAISPAFRFLEREEAPEIRESVRRKATDMVGTMALAYRNRKALFSDGIEATLRDITPLTDNFCSNEQLKENCAFFAKMITEAKVCALDEREMDEELTGRLEDVFSDAGFKNGVIRAFGNRKKYVICSGEDKDGTVITSPTLRKGIEETSGLKFSEPEYYRRQDMVLMQCEAVNQYKLSYAVKSAVGESGEISGDTAEIFDDINGCFYAIISDGMGSGELAKKTSEFTSRFLGSTLGSGASCSTIIHMINSIVRNAPEECSATVDLFSFDLITGEATFIKSGAAASYIKRKNSLFRIKSETMPLGIIKQVDAEKISAAVLPGDYVIMVSDGVMDSSEDLSWLPEILNTMVAESTEELAELIINAAKKNSSAFDDMSVIVMQIHKK